MAETRITPVEHSRQPHPSSLIHLLPESHREPNQRRQDKIIAAVVRHNPKLLLPNEIKITDQERHEYQQRLDSPAGREELDRTIQTLPLPVDLSRGDHRAKLFTRFAAEGTTGRHMRRVLAFVTKGSLAPQGQVEAGDLATFMRRVPNVVAFENTMADVLQAIDQANRPEDRPAARTSYMEALDTVGELLYGSQWVYLKQARLLEKQAEEPPPSPEPEGRIQRLVKKLILRRDATKQPDEIQTAGQQKGGAISRRAFLRGAAGVATGITAIPVGVGLHAVSDPEVRAGLQAAGSRERPKTLESKMVSDKMLEECYREHFSGKEHLLPKKAWMPRLEEGFEGFGRLIARIANIYYQNDSEGRSFDEYYKEFLNGFHKVADEAGLDFIVLVATSEINAGNTYTLKDLNTDITHSQFQSAIVTAARHFGLQYDLQEAFHKPHGLIYRAVDYLNSDEFKKLEILGVQVRPALMNTPLQRMLENPPGTEQMHIYDIIRLNSEQTVGMMDYEPSMNARALLLFGSDEMKGIFRDTYPHLTKCYQDILTVMGIPFTPIIEDGGTQRSPQEPLLSARKKLEQEARVYIDRFKGRLDIFAHDEEALAAIGIRIPLDKWQKNNLTDAWHQWVRNMWQEPEIAERAAVSAVKETMRRDFQEKRDHYYDTLMSQQIRNPYFLSYLLNRAKREGRTDEVALLERLQQGVDIYETQSKRARESYLLAAAAETGQGREYDRQLQQRITATTTRMLSKEAGDFDPTSKESIFWNICKLIAIREIAHPQTLVRDGGFARDISIDPPYVIGQTLYFLNTFEQMLFAHGIIEKPADQDVTTLMEAIWKIAHEGARDYPIPDEAKRQIEEFSKNHIVDVLFIAPAILRAVGVNRYTD